MSFKTIKHPTRNQCKNHGFSLFSAIFLLVVIAVLGSVAVTISTSQQKSTNMDELSSRAYQAAKAGMEWGVYQIINTKLTGASCAGPIIPPPPQEPLLSIQPPATPDASLSSFNITVQCLLIGNYKEGDNTITIYHLTSTAASVPAAATPGEESKEDDFFERQVELTFSVP